MSEQMPVAGDTRTYPVSLRRSAGSRPSSPPRVLILNGAPLGDTLLCSFVEREQAALRSQGASVVRHDLATETIAFCQGCFDCWLKTPGLCTIKDGANRVNADFVASDVVLLVSPIVFGGYGPELKKALDRSIGLVSPFFEKRQGETHHRARYARYPSLLAVGFQAALDAEEAAIFRALVSRHALNFRAPMHASLVVVRGDFPAPSVVDLLLSFAGTRTRHPCNPFT